MATLSIFLIGPSSAGKSTIFDALTSTKDGPNFVTKGLHKIGSVKVPNAELEQLNKLYMPKKYTPAEVSFVDVALPAATDDRLKLNTVAGFLGDASAFNLVLEAFCDDSEEGVSKHLSQQLESALLDLVISDLEKVERRIERIDKEKKRGIASTPDSEIQLLKMCQITLEKGKRLRSLSLSPHEEKALRHFQFLSMKPILITANIHESFLTTDALAAFEDEANREGLTLLKLCGALEAELAQLEPEEQAAFLADYGLQTPARAQLIQTAYELLDLISFYTVGEDEVKAWTVQKGTQAKEAAGKIHSDIERGFIRAEVVPSNLLIESGSLATCREKAQLRLEGKEYTVASGDVIHFRFSV